MILLGKDFDFWCNILSCSWKKELYIKRWRFTYQFEIVKMSSFKCYPLNYWFFSQIIFYPITGSGCWLCSWRRAYTAYGLWSNYCSRQCHFRPNGSEGCSLILNPFITTQCNSNRWWMSLSMLSLYLAFLQFGILQVGSFDAGYGSSIMSRLVCITAEQS